MAKQNEELKANETVNFTVRLEQQQREIIEEAAAVQETSVGRFVRDAALGRAYEVLNANGEREGQLRELAKGVIGHLFYVELVSKGEAGVRCIESELWKPKLVEVIVGGPDADPYDPSNRECRWSSEIDPGVKKAIRAAFENAGGEFIRLILEEWDMWGKKAMDYQPRFEKKHAFLSESEKDEEGGE